MSIKQPLSYRHLYHAGNHGDVLKHSTLACLVGSSLRRHGNGAVYVDTHSGPGGVYDLGSEFALKRGENRQGISRVHDLARLATLNPHITTSSRLKKFIQGANASSDKTGFSFDDVDLVNQSKNEKPLYLRLFGPASDLFQKIQVYEGYASPGMQNLYLEENVTTDSLTTSVLTTPVPAALAESDVELNESLHAFKKKHSRSIFNVNVDGSVKYMGTLPAGVTTDEDMLPNNSGGYLKRVQVMSRDELQQAQMQDIIDKTVQITNQPSVFELDAFVRWHLPLPSAILPYLACIEAANANRGLSNILELADPDDLPLSVKDRYNANEYKLKRLEDRARKREEQGTFHSHGKLSVKAKTDLMRALAQEGVNKALLPKDSVFIEADSSEHTLFTHLKRSQEDKITSLTKQYDQRLKDKLGVPMPLEEEEGAVVRLSSVISEVNGIPLGSTSNNMQHLSDVPMSVPFFNVGHEDKVKASDQLLNSGYLPKNQSKRMQYGNKKDISGDSDVMDEYFDEAFQDAAVKKADTHFDRVYENSHSYSRSSEKYQKFHEHQNHDSEEIPSNTGFERSKVGYRGDKVNKYDHMVSSKRYGNVETKTYDRNFKAYGNKDNNKGYGSNEGKSYTRSYGSDKYSDKPSYGRSEGRSEGRSYGSDKPSYGRSEGRSEGRSYGSDKPSYGSDKYNNKSYGSKPQSYHEKPQYSTDRPQYTKKYDNTNPNKRGYATSLLTSLYSKIYKVNNTGISSMLGGRSRSSVSGAPITVPLHWFSTKDDESSGITGDDFWKSKVEYNIKPRKHAHKPKPVVADIEQFSSFDDAAIDQFMRVDTTRPKRRESRHSQNILYANEEPMLRGMVPFPGTSVSTVLRRNVRKNAAPLQHIVYPAIEDVVLSDCKIVSDGLSTRVKRVDKVTITDLMTKASGVEIQSNVSLRTAPSSPFIFTSSMRAGKDRVILSELHSTEFTILLDNHSNASLGEAFHSQDAQMKKKLDMIDKLNEEDPDRPKFVKREERAMTGGVYKREDVSEALQRRKLVAISQIIDGFVVTNSSQETEILGSDGQGEVINVGSGIQLQKKNGFTVLAKMLKRYSDQNEQYRRIYQNILTNGKQALYDEKFGNKAKVSPGIVLIDPAYEGAHEFAYALDALRSTLLAWPNACVAVWYPILKDGVVLKSEERRAAAGEGYISEDSPIRRDNNGNPIFADIVAREFNKKPRHEHRTLFLDLARKIMNSYDVKVALNSEQNYNYYETLQRAEAAMHAQQGYTRGRSENSSLSNTRSSSELYTALQGSSFHTVQEDNHTAVITEVYNIIEKDAPQVTIGSGMFIVNPPEPEHFKWQLNELVPWLSSCLAVDAPRSISQLDRTRRTENRPADKAVGEFVLQWI